MTPGLVSVLLPVYNQRHTLYEIYRIDKHTWAKAGKGNWPECCFLNNNWVSVLWNGTIVSCCMDMEGEAKLGHVANGYHMRNIPWRACPTCEVVLPCPKK